ncbi:uncharacterized protein At1g21580 isoform X2 [Eutrema salsugineum]|uniref:uncharacterized protein At1g21580 isoform X2 n=1 Tax=Eutrema salsugineum TaxID=72664 RepID=UPI000CED1138|nr:uncharacterized protein At1g21580 isoform X2 [Eutrema salsugineum]
MDSSHYNPSYVPWNSPYSSHPPPAPLLPPPPPLPPPHHHQFHPESPNFYGRSSQNGVQHQDYHHYSHLQDLPSKPTVNQPSSYYSQHPPPPPPQQQHPPPLQQKHLPYIPQHVSYEPQRISQPSSSSIPCTESRDISQSAWVGYKEKRLDSWTVDAGQGRMDTGRSRVDPGPDRTYHQYDYNRSSRESSGVSTSRGLDGSSRSRDEFRNPGYVRKESGATRIEGNYQDRVQVKSESDRYFRGLDEGSRGLSSSVGYGSDRYGVTVSRDMIRSSASHEAARNQRRDEAHNGGRTLYPRKKDDYHHSEIGKYFDRGRREERNDSNLTPRKQIQKKSALLRLETPRSHQNGRENDWSRHHTPYSGKKFNSNSFRGKEQLGHSDRGLVEKQRRRTPVDLDVSFKSNLLVAKPVASPTSAGIHPSRSVTPRSSKARRALVPDKNEKAPVTEGNGKLRTPLSDGASVPEGSRQSTRQTTASETEKKPDNHSSLSSNDAGGLNEGSFVDGVVQDSKVKISDGGIETSTHDSEAKVCSTVHAAEKISSFCEALNEAKDDSNAEHDSNMEVCSAEEDIIDGDESIVKSHEDMLDRKGTGCNAGEALMPKVMEKEEIVKTNTKLNMSPIILPVSWPTAADHPGSSEGGVHFAGKFMCNVGYQPCEDEDMDCTPSPVRKVNTGLEERKSIGSSVGSLGYREKDFEKSPLDASIYCNSDYPDEQVLAKSDSGGIEDDNNGISTNVDSLSELSPEDDSSTVRPKGLVSSVSLDVANVSMDLADANNSVSGDLANANSFTVGTYRSTMVTSPDINVVFQVESKDLPHCEDTVNSSVENVSEKESMEPTPLNSAAEMAYNPDSDEGKNACDNGTSSSLTKVAVKESSNVLPVEKTTGCSRSDESDLAMAVPSEVCIENVSTEKVVPDEDLGLASHHPAEIPSVDQFSGLDSTGLKACLSEPNVSLNKDITDGASDCIVEQDGSQNASLFCDKLPSSSVTVIDTNLAIKIIGMSGSETVTDADSGILESQPCSTECELLPEDRLECGSSGAIGSHWNLSMGKNLEKDSSRVSSCIVSDSSVSPCHISPMAAVNEQIQNKTSIQANYSDSQGDFMHKENSQEEKTKPSSGTSKYRTLGTDTIAVSGDSVIPCNSLSSSPRRSFRQIRSEVHVAAMVDETSKVKESQKENILLDTLQEQVMTSHELTQPSSSFAHYPCLGKPSSGADVDSYVHTMSKYPGGDLVEKPNGDSIEKLTDVTSDVVSQGKYSANNVKTDIFEGEILSSDGKFYGTEFLGDSGVRLSRSYSHADGKVGLIHVKDHVVSVPHRDSKSKTSLISRYEIEERKKKSNYSTQKDANPPIRTTKRHTWHRKSDSASPFVAAKPLSSAFSTQQKFPVVTAQSSSSSYVRKGNSLLRKPSNDSPGVALEMPPSAIQLNRFIVEDKSMRSASKVDVDNASFLVKTAEIPTLERQSKPPSDSSTSKVSNATATSSGKRVLSYSMDHLNTGLPESIMDSASSGEANVPHSGGDTFKTSDTVIQTGYASDCQQERNPPKLDSSNLKRMVYVKRKANQLVAASDIHGASKSQIPPSDGYFKRSKNQLVRNSESRVHSPDDALDSRAAATIVSERSSSMAFSESAATRPYKQSKFSLVWTQNDPQSRMPRSHMRYQRILPQLVPWKRVTYWRRLMNSVSAVRSGSFSNISQKLSMMRKRHTVYTRSTSGYSLRKSKVFSIGGSHLKWSKSIERDSRKANEEATLAVAEFAKKGSEKHSGQRNIRTTSRNHLARERVFRIGSLRYKMDSSRRTLQRISDVDTPCSGPSENGKGAKRPFIPKRLVIGNEEYVRVGNGNQLVRDPKKRTRALANEKVRWSLHNARLRLAKKKKYCQFFTRFGKCNKDDGKCPYVHDPSKIAVCTKFLNGLCANANCKLTHKVIPERMPDCSYFLQGLCNNEACPYRHVHVNPSAAICDGFLKGYCSDGDECRKKHSYICPVFEATGSCSQGSKCKLHHPKNQSKGRKRKRPSEPSEKNSRGRYFGSLRNVFSESEPMIVDRRSTDSEDFGMEGLDFIFLGASEFEASDNNDPATEQSISSDNEAAVSIHNLIRPVALMQ